LGLVRDCIELGFGPGVEKMFPYSTTRLTCAALALLIGTASLSAQQTTASAADPAAPSVSSSATTVASTTQPDDPTLTLRNQKALESFEPPIDEEYRLGAGDQITLDFPGRPELAGIHTIGPDGMITLNIAGSVRIADLTRAQAAKTITEVLSRYYTNPEVTVKIDKYTANRVRVIGYVQHPGEIAFEGTPTLLDAIGRAGLISPVVTANGVSSNVGPSVPETCTIYRGNSTAVQIDLRQMLLTGNALADMRLRRNDIIVVPEPKHLYVSVMGQVTKPGSVALTPDSTLTSVLADAGCCTDLGGYNPKIHLVQKSTGKDIVVEYKKLLTVGGQQEYTIHPGDIIFVPVSGFNKAAGVIQKISPAATMVSFAALLGAG
jgi:polysaccharide export outer membrane protein